MRTNPERYPFPTLHSACHRSRPHFTGGRWTFARIFYIGILYGNGIPAHPGQDTKDASINEVFARRTVSISGHTGVSTTRQLTIAIRVPIQRPSSIKHCISISAAVIAIGFST